MKNLPIVAARCALRHPTAGLPTLHRRSAPARICLACTCHAPASAGLAPSHPVHVDGGPKPHRQVDGVCRAEGQAQPGWAGKALHRVETA